MKVFAIKDMFGEIKLDSIRKTEIESIRTVEVIHVILWKTFYDLGYRCIEIEINKK